MTTYPARILPCAGIVSRATWSKNAAVTWRARRVGTTEAAASGLSPEVLSIAATSSTGIRVTFKYPALDNVALRVPGNYTITPPLAVYSVAPEAVASPTYVDLVIDEQADGQLYTLGLQRMVKA